ncbi:MAG TPA: hypothetical protein VHC63_07245 [Acidimicrobiales bacterium]|nr:hypothetical protein [Acidimicrobiales bacterium]
MTTRVGFGRAVITPPLPVMLAGFGDRAGPATEVRDDLEVRAFYASSDGVGLCLLVCDLLGMSPGFANPVRAAVRDLLDLPAPAVLTACIHTHAGPSTMAGSERLGWPTPDGYLDILVRGCLDAAREARANAESATFHYRREALPDGLSVNRRGHPYAPHFAALDVRAASGARIGAIANVSIHPVALGPACLAVSSDWVGSFRNELERTHDGRAVLLSGALGDVNPPLHAHATGFYDNDNFEDADELGVRVAGVVGPALDAARPVGHGAVGVRRHRWVEVEATGALAAVAGVAGHVPVELVEWWLGDVELVTVPGEAFHALGNKIEAAVGGPMLLAGLSPVWQGYLPDPWGDGYEEGVSYGEDFVAGVRAALLS